MHICINENNKTNYEKKNHISLRLEQLVSFEWVVGEIESHFLQSLVAIGEMIGYVAAQSIGETTTQMIKIRVWQTLHKIST